MLVLHGSNQSGSRFRSFTGFQFDRFATEQDGVVAYPDAYRGTWNDARRPVSFPSRRKNYDDVAFAGAVLDTVAAQIGGGEHPVWVVGYSNGGQMTIRLAHEIPERLDGMALLSALQPAAKNLVPSASKTRRYLR